MSVINRTKSFNTIILLIVVVLLTGCLVGPDFENPVMEDLPDEFRFSNEYDSQEVNLEWWKLFNDPVLVSLVNTALQE